MLCYSNGTDNNPFTSTSVQANGNTKISTLHPNRKQASGFANDKDIWAIFRTVIKNTNYDKTGKVPRCWVFSSASTT